MIESLRATGGTSRRPTLNRYTHTPDDYAATFQAAMTLRMALQS
jgi:hypothetical protein